MFAPRQWEQQLRTETAIHFRKGRLLFPAGASLFVGLFLGGMAATALEDVSENPLILAVVLMSGLFGVFFLAIFAWVFIRVLSRAPALVVDERGLTDCSSISAVGFVPWTNIQDARPYGFRIMVILQDRKAVLRGKSFAKALGMRINGMMSVTPMWISTYALPVGVDELIGMVRERALAQPAPSRTP
jgi:hypothetical protein